MSKQPWKKLAAELVENGIESKLRELLIHREAVGFRRNQILSELYPIPPVLADDSDPDLSE